MAKIHNGVRIRSGKGSHIIDVIPGIIDHTLLRADATEDEILQLCKEAKKYKFACVCINPCYVSFCVDNLKNTRVNVCTVVGFPLGASTTAVKVAETEQALRDGAREIDMVMNIGMLKSGNDHYVGQDISAVVISAHEYGALVKVIFETSLLKNTEKIKACRIAKRAGADFVKTSTGFSNGGATVRDVALLRRTVGPQMGVKASGGIRTHREAIAMIRAGASRIGTSAGVKIIGEMDSNETVNKSKK